MARLGEVLVQIGACTSQAVQEALQNQTIFGGRLGTHLLCLGVIDEGQLADALRRLHQIPTVSGDLWVDPGAVALVRRELVERYEIVPFLCSDKTVTLLVADPHDFRALDDVAFATGRRVQAIVVPESRLWELRRDLYGIETRLRGIPVSFGHFARALPAAHAGATATSAATLPAARAGTPAEPEELMDEPTFKALYATVAG